MNGETLFKKDHYIGQGSLLWKWLALFPLNNDGRSPFYCTIMKNINCFTFFDQVFTKV